MAWTRRWRRYWRGEWRIDWRGQSFDAQHGGTTTDGAATFALDLEQGYTVRFDWRTGIIPTASGIEQRSARNNRAREFYSGEAWLIGTAPMDVRTTLAKFAARAEPFLLALPHEELLITDDSSGVVVPVAADELALTDWARAGQRVVVYREDDDGALDFVDDVIQSVGAASITLGVDPGDRGLEGGRIAPARAIYLDPEQDFARFEHPEEAWQIKARAIDFDYARTLASLAIGPLTTAAGLDSASVVEKVPGSSPTLTVTFGAIVGAELSESAGAVTVYVRTLSPATTVEQFFAALSTSTIMAPAGTWGTGALTAGDLFGPSQLTGGQAQGVVGAGASLTMYDGKPVWDWPIRVSGSVTDSIHALSEIVDTGGKPYGIGFADAADWGRAIALRSAERYDWQWFKLFMTQARGAQRTWWLPTHRNDLPFVSKATNVVTVTGDLNVWYPTQREHIQIEETSGTVTRAKITSAVDNGNGTWTLTIGTTLASSSVRRVSWLERCRFERDEIDVRFTAHGFELATMARVVQA
jgi:hypothetical protein